MIITTCQKQRVWCQGCVFVLSWQHIASLCYIEMIERVSQARQFCELCAITIAMLLMSVCVRCIRIYDRWPSLSTVESTKSSLARRTCAQWASIKVV